jgi:hypothetical protein
MVPSGRCLCLFERRLPMIVEALLVCFAATLLLTGITTASNNPPDKTDGSQAKFAFQFVSLTDPACPATAAVPHAPVTNEIRVLYYPMATRALIKEPKTLVLHVVLGHENMPFTPRTIPFTLRNDGVWVASLNYEPFAAPKYAIYWVAEPRTKLADTNGGNYFEVPFCDVHGQLSETSVRLQAQSYTGVLEAHGIERPVNYLMAGLDAMREAEPKKRRREKGNSATHRVIHQALIGLWSFKTPDQTTFRLADLDC